MAGRQHAGGAGSIIESMVIDMNEAQVRTLEQVRQVLAGTQAMEFQAAADDAGRYGWIESVLKRFEYPGCLGLIAAQFWPTCSV